MDEPRGGADVKDLVAAVDRAARLWPDRPAWTFDPGESLTFAEVASRTVDLAAALADTVTAGDRVAVMLENRAEFPLTWLALARLGAVMVPVNPQYRAEDDGHILGHFQLRDRFSQPSVENHVDGLHVLRTGVIEHLLDNLVAASDTAGAPLDCAFEIQMLVPDALLNEEQ